MPSFNPKDETPKAWVWISLPDLPPDLFARSSLLSIATAAGKPIAVDKETQDRTTPSTARVKIILDLLDKHPNHVRLQFQEKESGKIIEHYQRIVYDNLPLYCTHSKHQGHEENQCRLLLGKTLSQGDHLVDETGRDVALTQSDSEANNMEQLQGDARDLLKSKRVAKRDIEKSIGDQNVVQKLARNHSSLATVDGVSKLHGICTNEFGIDTFVDSTPKSTLIGEEAVKEGADYQVIPESSILPNENSIENDLEIGNRGDMSTSSGDRVFGTPIKTTQHQRLKNPNLMQQVDVSGIGNFNHESLNEVPQHVEKSVHQAKEIVVSTAMNMSEDVDDLLAIMLDKDLNKGRGTCSNENWNIVIHRKASSNVSPGSRSNFSNDLLYSNSFDAFLKNIGKDGNVMAPTLHIFNPEVNKIIQECEAAMALKSNLAIKPSIVTLNTLAHEVPTQSLESFRELQGESGQLILSKGNDKDLVKGMSSLSQTNLTNNLFISKENQGERSAPMWADLVDEEVQVSPPILNGKLSPQALEFVPKSVIAKKNEVEALA
ncbi:hypothetical protein KY289_023547 [Solanum tuberosum]|nr:hypothetical protein KY289_023547 [Solanum tuberosum]